MELTVVFISLLKSHYFYPINLKVKIFNIFMASLDSWIKSPHFFMISGHFNTVQMCGLKINDHQLFLPQAHGTEFNYCPSLDLSADNLSD